MPRPTRLAFITVPLAIAPLIAAVFGGTEGVGFFFTFGSMCIAAPAVGFWLGEMRGRSGEGRAAIGCLGTLALFAFYFLWALLVAPAILRVLRAP